MRARLAKKVFKRGPAGAITIRKWRRAAVAVMRRARRYHDAIYVEVLGLSIAIAAAIYTAADVRRSVDSLGEALRGLRV